MNDGAKSARWHEEISADEAAQIGGFIDDIRRFQAGFARGGDGRPNRGFHVKIHAGLTARFRVMDDIPPEARHGLFATPRTFPAWVRFSNGFSTTRPDWFPDLAGFAVKLHGVDGIKLLADEEQAATQDFLALNQPYLPAENPRQLMIMSLSSANVLTAPFILVRELGWAEALRVMGWTLAWTPRRLLMHSVATEDFHSTVPITIGPHAVKFQWKARQAREGFGGRGASWRNYLRGDLRRRLAAGDLRFDFLAQFYADPITTPIDGAAAWNAGDAPFVKLAELTIPGCDIDAFAVKHEEIAINAMAFNPWHAIAAHRPIGNIQRARRLIYQASARFSGRDADPPA